MLSQSNLLSIAVWAIFFGVMFSVAYITLQKHSLGKFILALTECKAFTPESSKTLCQLGISNKIISSVIYSAIKNQHGLIRIIGFCSSDNQKSPGEFSRLIPSDDCSFYIDESASCDALAKYSVKKSNKVYVTICIVVLFIIACLATTVISWLFSYAGNVFSGRDSDKNDVKTEDVAADENTDTEDNNTSDIIDENQNTDITNSDTVNSDSDTEQSDDNASNSNIPSDNSDTEQDSEQTITRPTIPKGPMN